MDAVEVVLIIIGVIFLLGSHFLKERLSQKDLEQITIMTEKELKAITEKQIREARIQVENAVEEVIDEALEITQRGLERETNHKIMAISDYSDTVMESINKTHNEIMFLYSMLNDKHTEMTDLVTEMKKCSKPLQETVSEYGATEEDAAVRVENVSQISQGLLDAVAKSDVIEETEQEDVLVNKNEQILKLHKEGKGEVEIAKTLDCGLGEVRLVLGLYKEE